MADIKKDGLPKIMEKRLKTEGRSASYRSNQPNFRKFTFNLKTELQGNEYLKSWINREDESKKMQKILKQNLKEKPLVVRPAVKSVNKTSLTLKNEIYPQLADYEFIQNHIAKGNTSSLVLNKQKISIVLEKIEVYYDLQIKNKELSKQKMRGLKQLLQQSNPLFQKLNTVISESLLKIGTITTYQANELVYKENFPIKNIGVILWGEAVLKYKRSKAKYNCMAGSTIGEQLVFEDVDYSSKKYSTVQKGQLCTNQRCKAIKNCGIVFIGERQFGYMLEDLIKWGFREETMRFKNILHRNYLKKRQFRSSMF